MTIIDDAVLFIRKERVLALLGQKDGDVSARLSRKIDKQIDRLEKLIRPRVLYTTKKINKVDNNTLAVEGDIELKSAKLSKTFKKCDRATFFLATIGDQVDNLVGESLEMKKLSDAYIYDAIGSAAVEATVDGFQKQMDQKFGEKNRRTTLRFSPGYCDWKIHEQKKVFSVLDNDLIGVDLNESCLMAPRKSVSGVFGIGSSDFIDNDKTNPCRLCGMKSCIARR